jgi:saccharopine dehydrogenase-like NADP-dependent oxidoreductase
MFEYGLLDRIKEEKFSNDLVLINITDFRQCDHAIRKSDLVISMVPDVMLLQVVDSCILHRKSLITPSRMNRQMLQRKNQAEENDVLLLLECGFSPGLDHITAKKVIDNIYMKKGEIFSFKTYSGSLISEEHINNNWQFKLTEPARDLISLGKHSNRHLMENEVQHVPYQSLFQRAEEINVRGQKDMIAIPEGDALYYRKIYQLNDAHTVVKGKLLRKGFDKIWDLIIRLGLTDTTSRIDLFDEKSFYYFLSSLLPHAPNETLEGRLKKFAGASREDVEKLKELGLFDSDWLSGYKEITPAIVLQHLLENKFSLHEADKDCIMMQHQLEYQYKTEYLKFTATLVAQGETFQDSATAKAIGLTAGAAAKAFLLGNIKIRGLHIPCKKDIYDPILNELDDVGVAFHVEEVKIRDVEVRELDYQR